MGDSQTKVDKVAQFLRTVTRSGGLSLDYKIACNGQVQPGTPIDVSIGVEVQPESPADVSAGVEVQPTTSEPAGKANTAANSSETTSSSPEITVEFSGPDVPLLLARNGELLLALEHVAAKVLRFEHEEHDRISFDAENFKVLRHEELRMAAQVAIERVRHTGQPFNFAPMSSRERRLLHLELAAAGMATASQGEGSRRFVVLYPEGSKPVTSTAERTQAIRANFRRR